MDLVVWSSLVTLLTTSGLAGITVWLEWVQENGRRCSRDSNDWQLLGGFLQKEAEWLGSCSDGQDTTAQVKSNNRIEQ